MDDFDEAINHISVGHGPGPDRSSSINNFVNCRDSIKHGLLDLLNLLLQLGVFPNAWKLSFLLPPLKGGDSTDVDKYRPINKYKVYFKMFEHLVKLKVFPYLKKFIIQNQHGFLEGRFVTNLTIYSEFITSHFNNGVILESIYTDLTRAFDLVNFNLICRKLYA